jgi:ParB-like chromosome segregation protein Spo0J
MDIQEIEIEKIIPYINNPRKNLNVDKVASSIKEFGFQQPIVVDKTNTIVVGHTRYEAAKKLGITKVPVQIANLSENQAKAYRIADNRLNQDASWDTKLLNIEFNDLLSKDYNLDSLGFTTDELDTLFLKSSEDADIGLNENIEEDLDLTQETLSDVKMIQLFFNAENESKFREAINKISKENNIDNISDAVLRCVLNEADKT